MCKLSIIVPVYNVGALIKRCIESLINQSFKDIEIIIINDGSTDETESFIHQYLSYPMIKYFSQENHGLGATRNFGLHKANGEYIAFVDSDDWVDLDLYQEMLQVINVDKSDIAICGVKNEYENFVSSEERYTYKYSNKITNIKALSMLSQYENNNYMISPVVWNKIYRKTLILDNNITFLGRSYWEDDVFSFQILTLARTVSIVPDSFYHYYHREQSITNDFSKKHIDDLIESFKNLKCYVNTISVDYDINSLFQAYFDRAIRSLLKMLFTNEPSLRLQKEYILYLFKGFSESFSVYEAIKYLDIGRIRRLFT